jgi:hypothetical protein
MASAAKSIPSNPLPGHANRGQLRAKSNISLPPVHGEDAWFEAPAYRKLDSEFLQRPRIPRAPAAPRLRIDRVNGSLRVLDPADAMDFSDVPETNSLAQVHLSKGKLPLARRPFVVPTLSILVGFLAGLVAALILGWL